METINPRPEWLAQLKPFEAPVRRRAVWQLVNSLLPYLALLTLMYFVVSAGYPVWLELALILLLSIPAAGFLVRIFIIFHDCSHGSFFASRRANRTVGTILGLLTFTAYDSWRYGHGVHHAGSGNLDRRTIGEIWTLTLEEYRKSPWVKRLGYRIYRNPLFLFFTAPLLLFIVVQRLPDKIAHRRQVVSIITTDLFIAGIVAMAWLTIGLKAYLLIQLPVMYFAGMGGIWLFYVQHQFDPGYWERTGEWSRVDSALEGSSYYKLPGLLQWFSANIGLHHIHHLKPRIPNYNLQACLDAVPQLRLKDHLTIRRSLVSVRLNLWDEVNRRFIGFRGIRKPQSV